MGWVPAVLSDASAPVQLAVLAVTDQLGVPLLVVGLWLGSSHVQAALREEAKLVS